VVQTHEGREIRGSPAVRELVISRKLPLYAQLEPVALPVKLDWGLCEAAFPLPSRGFTFAYIQRRQRSTFGWSWPKLRKLMQDPLCVRQKDFGKLLPSSQRGRKPAYDWPAFDSECIRVLQEEGDINPALDPKSNKTALEQRMKDWCGKAWGKVPADSTVGDHVEAFWKRSGNAQSPKIELPGFSGLIG
jgi:hypothetical protein